MYHFISSHAKTQVLGNVINVKMLLLRRIGRGRGRVKSRARGTKTGVPRGRDNGQNNRRRIFIIESDGD